jgi:hypothetical protein
MPKRTFSLALLLPGLIMLLMGIATSYTAFGEFLLNLFGALTKELIQLMFYGSGFIMLVLGVSVLVTRK